MRSRNLWFLGLLGVAALGALGTAGLVVALTWGPRIPPNSVLMLEISGEIPEEGADSFLDRLVAGERKTVLDIDRMLRRASRDPRLAGVLVRIGPLEEGWGKIQELRDAFAAVEASGKPVVASLEFAGTKEYYLATGAGRIAMVPSGVLLLNGLAVQLPFAKGALDRARIRADLEHVGEYKDAGDVFTRERPSTAQLEAMNDLLDSLYGQLIAGIAASRKLTQEKTRETVDRGILSAAQALEAGLVDELAYADQVREGFKKKAAGVVRELDETTYLDSVRRSRGDGARIALIYATGTIVPGRSSRSQYAGRLMGSDTVAHALAEARRDDGIRAIVLRVDSPGGSGVASDVIWRETQLARKKKPLVVSMSDLAASGGYWISMGADAIVAEPATLTASIGVVGGKFDLGGLYEWVGLHWEILQRGRHADLFTDAHGFTEEQREIVRASMEGFYREFVSRVGEGRKMKREDVERAARGRVWTGQQARDLGLVDRLGGLDVALDLVREKAGIPESRPLSLEVFPRGKGFLESLREGDVTRSSLALPEPLRALAARAELSERLGRETVLLLLPDPPVVH